MMQISVSMMRLTWAVVEEVSPRDLLALSDTMLVKLLMQRIAQTILLNGEEVCALYEYLGAKVTLIRDIAESRQVLDPRRVQQSYLVGQAG